MAGAVGAHGEELVDLDAVELEVERAGRHVQALHLRAFEAHLPDGVVPMFGEVAVPVVQRQRG